MPMPYSIDQGIHYGEESKLEMKNGESNFEFSFI